MSAVGAVPARALAIPEAQVATAERYLVVNADDFGRTDGTTSGIIRAHERGIVTSTSLMVRWPAAEQAAAYARAWPQLGVGLHVDLEEWTVLDDAWTRTYAVVDLDDRAAVSEEIQRQIDEFRRLVGRDPTHLDSHQHVHLQGPVRGVFGEAARRLGVPLRRLTPGIGYRGDFYGQTSRGDPYPEGITVEALIAVISGLAPGVSELACHPGEAEDWDSVYRLERTSELHALCDPRVGEALVAAGVGLRSFGDVAREIAFDTDSWRTAAEQLGVAAFNAAEYDDSVSWFGVATSADPANVGSWLWLSRAQARQHDTGGAREALEQAIGLQPGWVSVKLQHADLLAQEDRPAEAVAILEEVVERHADRADLLRRAAQRLADLKADAAATRAADALLALAPNDEQALFAKAGALWRAGEIDQARILVNPEGGRPSGRLAARFHLEAAEPASAWEAAATAKGIAIPLLLGIANGLRRSGAISSTIAALERAAALAPGNKAVQRQLEVAADEAAVLQGQWHPPEPSRRGYRSKRGRVLHIVGHSAPHSQVGYTIRTHSIARAQLQVGLKPHVVTRLGFPWDDGVAGAESLDELDGVRYHRVRGRGPTSRQLGERLSETVLQTAEVVKRVRPAVLHAASDYRNALVALAVGSSFGIPVVYEVRGFWEETRLASQGAGAGERECYLWHAERELECMQQADRVVTLAQTMRARIVERGVDAAAITVIPNAVDTERFVPVGRDAALAERLGIAPDEVMVGYISSFSSYEGIRYLIDATARLAGSGRRVRCLLVGDGDQRLDLEAHAQAAGIADRVIFTGRVPHGDVLAYYGLIDVFVVPRTDDRVSQLVTPLKPYEAMATGRAVVVSRVPALAEMILEGETALAFRPEDADDLAAVLEGLLDDPARRAELGAAGREWVCRHRTWRGNGDLYLELYRALGAV